MTNISITINGKKMQGRQGDTILDIATAHGMEIPTLCHHESVKLYGACGLCVVEAQGNPKLLRSCSTAATDGMVIETETPRLRQSRKIALELLLSDHVGDCLGPCVLNCPAGTDCQGYVKQIALGNDREAVRIIKEKIPLPASIGRICPHPCEDKCRRALVEEPISIAYLKAFAADNDLATDRPYQPIPAPPTGKRAAIVGGGPGGLSAAYYLALAGHQVTVYDFMPEMGGMLRYGIPEYRLPKLVLDMEIKQIAALGVHMINNVRVGKDLSLSELTQAFDAVLIAIGAWKSSALGCEGEELPGVFAGIDFLREAALGHPQQIGKRVAVVGGGNTAMDACRTAVRLGAQEVSIVYRRTEAEMPAERIEIEEAREEGVIFRFLAAPAEVLAENGRVSAMRLQKMELGEPDASGRRSPIPIEGAIELLPVDSVIAAIGQKVDISGFEEIELNRRGIIAADESSFLTNLEGVFAIGDATNKGASIAIDAIAEAGKAAISMDAYLKGEKLSYRPPFVSVAEPDEHKLRAEHPQQPRAIMPRRLPDDRKRDFGEVNFGFSEEQARREAERCLECGCHDYAECRLIRYSNLHELDVDRFQGEKHDSFKESKLVSIYRDQGKCILCNLCVRVCEEVVGKGILGLVGRGFSTVVKPEFETPDIISACLDCRKCVDACVTGALRMQPAEIQPVWVSADDRVLEQAEEILREHEENIGERDNDVLLAAAQLKVLGANGHGGERERAEWAMSSALAARTAALEKGLLTAYDLQRKHGRAMTSCINELSAVEEQLDAYTPGTGPYESLSCRIPPLQQRYQQAEHFYNITGSVVASWKRRLYDIQQNKSE